MPTDLLANNRAVLGYSFSGLTSLAPQVIAATARQALALLANDQVRVKAIHTLPLERAAEAHRLIEAGNTTGKLLLRYSRSAEVKGHRARTRVDDNCHFA